MAELARQTVELDIALVALYSSIDAHGDSD
jgi:hypothetical protein